nr:MAG TPA: antirepressor protein [Caudoviricetes sp.]DAL53594.1 MAG TPA_asm: antirepressor protein [Bacteriophage sp.]
MKELIKIEVNENQEPIVNGRELHETLGIKTEYKKWFERMKKYGFTENTDYVRVTQKCHTLGGEQEMVNHAIKLDMAKEIAMIQRNEKGKKVRQYFIQVEKDFNSPEKIMARALKIAESKLNVLQLENTQQKQLIGELKPKADYLDQILQSKALVTITAIAKDYGMSAKAFNKKLHELKVQFKQGHQWFLYSSYHNCGYTHSETVEYTHSDGRKDVTMNTKWTQKGRLFLYELLKKNGLVPVIER